MRFKIQLHRLNLPAFGLLLLLQRTPVLRLVTGTAEFFAPSRVVALLKSAFATAASLGAVHSLAGATRFVVSSPTVIGGVGTPIFPFAFSVVGAAVPAGSYRVSGALPPGLAIAGIGANGVLNGATGIITGTPTAAGTFAISILAYENPSAAGDSFGPVQVVFLISGPPTGPPAITVQPSSQSANAGATVTLGVAASGNPAPAFQWRKDGVALAGATGSALTLGNVQPASAGTYTVVVSNAAGSVASLPAVLTVSVASGAASPRCARGCP